MAHVYEMSRSGISDFSLRIRVFCALVEPILAYRAELWAPPALSSSVNGTLSSTVLPHNGRRPSAWCGTREC